jgi:two-component sensor histidine kinase
MKSFTHELQIMPEHPPHERSVIPITEVRRSIEWVKKHFWTQEVAIGADPAERAHWIYPACISLLINVVASTVFCIISVGIGSGSITKIFNALPVFIFIGFFIGYTIHLLILLGTRMVGAQTLRAWAGPKRAMFYGGLSLSGGYVGWIIAGTLLGYPVFSSKSLGGVLAITAFSMVMTFIVYTIVVARERTARAEAAEAKRVAELAQAERNLSDANLRALQAQIEPHFLFNTLANVHTLIDISPDKAKAMLEALDGLLRSSLNKTRAQKTTLSEEFAMAQRYLDILKIRMDDRLQVSLQLDPSLSQFELPPLTLQPLIENAINHGLEPKIDGGSINVTAARSDSGDTVLTVADTGLGMPETGTSRPKGTGIGTTNVRERLASFFGPHASLEFTRNTPTGTIATILIKAT